MRIDDLQAEIRPRSPWEAADLGVALARANIGPLGRAWLGLVVPAQLFIFILFTSDPWLALGLIWWLGPVWERVALFVLSRTLFGVRPKVMEVASGLARVGWRGLLLDLTFLRMAPTRTILLPVSLLEGGTGGLARMRRSALAADVRGTGLALALSTNLVGLGMAGGLLVLLLGADPAGSDQQVEDLFFALMNPSGLALIPFAALASGILAVVLILRTSACFGLYLQRRTVLEGWDVELIFRRLGERLARRIGGAALLLALCLGPGLHAEEPPPDEARVVAVTAEVLGRAELVGTEQQRHWRLRQAPESEEEPTAPITLPGVSTAAEGMSSLLLGLLGVALVGLLGSVLVGWRGGGRSWRWLSEELPEVGPIQGGLADLAPDPEAPAQAAWALWQRGDQDAALALLYRAAVTYLVEVRGLELSQAATEGDCLRATRRALPGRTAAYMGRLTLAWQQRAYAHRRVDEATMQILVDGWPDLEGGAS